MKDSAQRNKPNQLKFSSTPPPHFYSLAHNKGTFFSPVLAAFLPVLALLFSLSATAPAQAQTTVWSATLTAQDIGSNSLGCDNSGSGKKCSSASILTDDDFTVGGVTYEMTSVGRVVGGGITFIFDRDVSTALDAYSLCIGSTAYGAFSDAIHIVNTWAEWRTVPSAWTAGEKIQLSIGTSCPPDSTLGVSGLTVTPGNGKLYLSWTAPSATVTGYDVHYTSSSSVTIGAAVGSDPATGWATVTRSGTATTQEISGLTNKTSYRVRVRGKSSDANGAWLARGDTPRLYGSLSGLTGRTSTDGSTFGGTLTLSPAFFAGTLAYAAAVAADVTHVRLTPGVNYGNERVNVYKSSGGGSTELSADSPNADIALDRGVTEIRVTVTNKHETEGLQRRYTVTVTREGVRPTTPNRGGTGTGGGGGGGPSTPTGDNEPSPGSDGEPSTSCPPGDRETLRNFYQMTNGEGWDRHENWNSEEPLGEWFGVKTEDGNVVSLRLADNGLSGNMPTRELLCLTELVELALWDNDDLSGEVPEKLVLAVERAALRYLAETLDINREWFKSYEDPYDFEDWHEGVTIDDDGRVTELDLTGERVTEEEIPGNIYELLPRLGGIMITRSSEDGGCALSPEASSAFSLFLLTLLVFAALVRRRARG